MVTGNNVLRPRESITGHSKKLIKPRAMINKTARLGGKQSKSNGIKKVCHWGLQPGDHRKKMMKVSVVKMIGSSGGEVNWWRVKINSPSRPKGIRLSQEGIRAELLSGMAALAGSKWSARGPKLPVVVLPSRSAQTVS